jgi:bifunctional non-homologous end joining protein LigD
MIAPQLAKASATIPTGPGWVCEAKYDGWRVIAEVLADEVILRTRTGNRITQVPYINNALKALPPGTIIDGEIVDLTNGTESTFNRVVSVLKRNDPQRVCLENLPLTYVAFDIIEADGQTIANEPLSTRREVLETAFNHPSLADQRLCEVKLLAIADQFPSSEAAFDACIAAGFEGVVVKQLSHSYSFGARNWIKIKPDAEVEAICTGVYDAEAGSKYDGRCVGGITFTLTHEDGTTFEGQCAGKMNDTLRSELYANPDRFKGLVVEIGHWGVTDNGSLRHPSFRRFREDKSAAEVNPVSAPAHIDLTQVHNTGERERIPSSAVVGESKPKKKGKRNYRQMKDDKLLRTAEELERALSLTPGESNEAISKSTDPEADLITVRELIAERGL